MHSTVPSQNIELLKSLLGKRIITVKRQLYRYDIYNEDYQQIANGPVEFTFDDNTVIHFITKPSIDSVGIVSGVMPRFGDKFREADVTDSAFWAERITQKIMQVAFLKEFSSSTGHPNEFGVEFSFNNGKTVVIELLEEETYPNMTKVGEQSRRGPCITQLVGWLDKG